MKEEILFKVEPLPKPLRRRKKFLSYEAMFVGAISIFLVVTFLAPGPLLCIDASHMTKHHGLAKNEVYFGDAIYMSVSIRNFGWIPWGVLPVDFLDDKEYPNNRLEMVLTCSEIAEKYRILREDDREDPTEKVNRLYRFRMYIWKTMYPLEKLHLVNLRIELPTLDEMEHLFWQQALALLEKNGKLDCRLEVTFSPYVNGWNPGDRKRVLRKTIPVKLVARGNHSEEVSLMKSWAENMPRELLPIRDVKNRRRYMPKEGHLYIIDFLDYPGDLNQVTEKRLSQEERKLQTWLTRKPMYPNAPTTLEGWRELEQQFSPSTVRDEIQLRRMIFERALASEGEEHAQKHLEIVKWLMTLPFTQRTIMAADFGIKLPER